MNISQINTAIMQGNFTNDELISVADATRFARAQLVQKTKRSMRVGGTVKFTSARNGITYVGKVDKIKVKFILVNTPQGRFNVPANMLEAV